MRHSTWYRMQAVRSLIASEVITTILLHNLCLSFKFIPSSKITRQARIDRVGWHAVGGGVADWIYVPTVVMRG